MTPSLLPLLESLTQVQYEPLGGLLPRRSRLIMARHDRMVVGKWRALRDELLTCGVPGAQAWIVPGGRQNSYFRPRERQGGSGVVMPTRKGALDTKGLHLTDKCRPWAQLAVLLHEWAHALLHPPCDTQWADALDDRTLYHADPAWHQMEGYAGWHVFNEIFADTWSTAWLLKLSRGDQDAEKMIESLTQMRQAWEERCAHIKAHCMHPTSTAMRQVAMERPEQAHAILNRSLAISQDAFIKWLDRDGGLGEKACKFSLRALLDMETPGTYSASWLASTRVAFNPIPSLLARTQALRLRHPQHPLFTLSSAQPSQHSDTPI